MSVRADVAIVGGGIMGSATAWWLARQGVKVVLVEQFEAGHERGSSHGRSRLFRVAYPERPYIQMARESRKLWRQIEEASGKTLLDITGGLDFGDARGVAEVAEALTAEGVAFAMMPAAEADERWAGFRFETDVLVQPDTGRIRAVRALAAFQEEATDAGADLRFSTPVEKVIVKEGGVEIVTGRDTIVAKVAVVTAGAWLPALVGDQVQLPPLKVTQEQVFHFTRRFEAGNMLPFIDHRSPYIYGLSTPGEGFKVAEHHGGTEVLGPNDRSFEVDPEARRRVVDYVRKWITGLDPAPHHESTCLYTSTADETFFIDRQGPVVIGSPCSGHGFKFAPLIGRRLAELATSS